MENPISLRLLLAYVIFLHLFVALVVVKSGFIEKTKLGVHRRVYGFLPEITDPYQGRSHRHLIIDKNMPENSIIFLGDSFVERLCIASFAGPAVNFGLSGDTTVGLLNRIGEFDSIKSASIIVVSIGFNDLRYRDNTQILENYAEILSHPSFQGKSILVSAVFPVDETVLSRKKWATNRRIEDLNKQLEKLSFRSSNIHFMETSDSFIDANQNLDSNLHVGDGVHLNQKGYEIWINELHKELSLIRSQLFSS